METITFHCKVITPMFLAGADGQTPELRAPSIKGAMRFWWRAVNGHLGVEEMRKREGMIFGDTSRRSQVNIRVLKQPKKTESNVELLPHKSQPNQRSPKECYPKGEEFIVRILMPQSIRLSENSFFNREMMESLFLLMSYLGGLGKRSRRGCGSFKVISINKETQDLPSVEQEIIDTIKEVNPNFSFGSSSNYPAIRKIEIGSSPKTIRDIGLATHDEKIRTPSTSFTNWKGKEVTKYPNYDATIGAGNPRFASPIYISILPDGKPIITTLETVSPKPDDLNIAIQESLKKRII